MSISFRGLTQPGTGAEEAIGTSLSSDYDAPANIIFFICQGTAGNIDVTWENGKRSVFPVLTGVPYPLRFKTIHDTSSTTATNLWVGVA